MCLEVIYNKTIRAQQTARDNNSPGHGRVTMRNLQRSIDELVEYFRQCVDDNTVLARELERAVRRRHREPRDRPRDNHLNDLARNDVRLAVHDISLCSWLNY